MNGIRVETMTNSRRIDSTIESLAVSPTIMMNTVHHTKFQKRTL